MNLVTSPLLIFDLNMPSPLGQSLNQLPVGAVVGGCYVAVNLQSSLVVYVSQPVTFQSFIGSSAA